MKTANLGNPPVLKKPAGKLSPARARPLVGEVLRPKAQPARKLWSPAVVAEAGAPSFLSHFYGTWEAATPVISHENPKEPLKIPWLIDCYRGLYYLVYWGL
jgi:hypothetical protein